MLFNIYVGGVNLGTYELAREDIENQSPLVFVELNDSVSNNGVDFNIINRKKSIFEVGATIDEIIYSATFVNDNPIDLIKEIIYNCKIYNYEYIVYNGQKITESELIDNFFIKNNTVL